MLVESIDRTVVVGRIGVVNGVGAEDIGRSTQTTLESIIVKLCARERTTDVGADRELVKALVYVEHHVTINALVYGVRVGVETIVRVSEEVDGRSIALVLRLAGGTVEADTAHYVQPVENLVLQAAIDHIAMLLGSTVHAIGNPVGVLHRQSVTEVPVLNIDTTRLVKDFKGTDSVKALTTWEEVERYQRVEVLTLSHEVHVALLHIVEVEVESQLVVQEVGRVAECEVVTVIAVVGHDTIGIGSTYRCVSLVLAVTYCQRHVVLNVGTGVEEVFGLETCKLRTTLFTPRANLTGTVGILVLELGHLEYV